MRRSSILALALAAATLGFAATSVFGDGADQDLRPAYATVEVDLRPAGPGSPGKIAAKAKGRSKPKVIYLTGEGTVNTDPAAGGTGPYIDFELTAPRKRCPRVINGGVNPGSLDLFQQGSYVSKGSYHVLMGLDDNAADTPASFPYESHVICLKGVR